MGSFALYAQNDFSANATPQIRVYPNPAAEYIRLSSEEEVDAIHIFNIIGRKVAEFNPTQSTDGKYYVSELPKGMYLVRLIGKNNMTLQTVRINKVNP
jgi:hypothetical protein